MVTNPDCMMPRMLHAVTRCASLVCIFAAPLALVPCLHAQSDAQQASLQVVKQPEPDLYSMKFDGRDVDSLEQTLKSVFPSDNVVIAPSARHIRLDAFEVRNVRVKELGRTIEFLSEGRLIVEVIEREKGTTGNIWRIASKSAAGVTATANLKMRAFAAPNLFRNEESVERIVTEASELENFRLRNIVESANVRGGDFAGVVKTEIRPLMSQKVFVLVGNEEGIAGVESFIKATEQLAVDEAAKKVALASSLAPTMRAVLAPHLFKNEERLDRITKEFENVQGLWSESHADLMKMIGIDDRRGGVCVQQRPDQKLLVLIGSERDIAGMESLIDAAEKNAAEQDLRELELMTAEKVKMEAAIRKEAEATEKAKKSDR